MNTNLSVVHSPAQFDFECLNGPIESFYAILLIFIVWTNAFQGGGSLVSTLRKSYSLSDLSEPDMHHSQDEVRYQFAVHFDKTNFSIVNLYHDRSMQSFIDTT